MMADLYKEHLERRARAIAPTWWALVDHKLSTRNVEREIGISLDIARATMEADRTAGLALVPREATEEMKVAFVKAHAHATDLRDWEHFRTGVNAAIDAGDILKGDGE